MDFGIVYHVESPHQFWSELEDIISLPSDLELSALDAAVRRFISFCAEYHQQFLQTKHQLDHCCQLLLDSDLFAFHSGRSSEILLDDATHTTDPHALLIMYSVLLSYGRRQPAFFRTSKKWMPLIPLLMDNVLIDIDDDWIGGAGGINGVGGGFIENKLRILGVEMLYEVCRYQKMDEAGLKVFTDDFLDGLFELVEQTRNQTDESLNYLVIKLIVSLNEQFMVANIPTASTSSHSHQHHREADKIRTNRVLEVFMRRLGHSKSFGANMIFMLNRADGTSEDLCMQLLILKILYLLFTTPGTQEYFYTNDLRVLVDVFMRELSDLPEESESLRHTYLRVLHPLLTNTQLRSVPYKRPHIRRTLLSLLAHSNIRDINPTTKRLVQRCLSAEWCVELEGADEFAKSTSTGVDGVAKADKGEKVVGKTSNSDPDLRNSITSMTEINEATTRSMLLTVPSASLHQQPSGPTRSGSIRRSASHEVLRRQPSSSVTEREPPSALPTKTTSQITKPTLAASLLPQPQQQQQQPRAVSGQYQQSRTKANRSPSPPSPPPPRRFANMSRLAVDPAKNQSSASLVSVSVAEGPVASTSSSDTVTGNVNGVVNRNSLNGVVEAEVPRPQALHARTRSGNGKSQSDPLYIQNQSQYQYQQNPLPSSAQQVPHRQLSIGEAGETLLTITPPVVSTTKAQPPGTKWKKAPPVPPPKRRRGLPSNLTTMQEKESDLRITTIASSAGNVGSG